MSALPSSTSILLPSGTPTALPADNRRASPRSTLVCKGILYADQGPPAKVFLSNISMTGVGLRTIRPMMPGSTHRLTVEVGPLSLRTRIRIVHCARKDDRTWEAGCAFVLGELATTRTETVIPARVKESVSRNPTRMLTPKG